jgi:hypothetical protein
MTGNFPKFGISLQKMQNMKSRKINRLVFPEINTFFLSTVISYLFYLFYQDVEKNLSTFSRKKLMNCEQLRKYSQKTSKIFFEIENQFFLASKKILD